ncbi:MAG: histone deacetylase family protein [Rhodospirillales bacterium]|nr:histone deacetylase family protein [Rhodospirillales bacterium]
MLTVYSEEHKRRNAKTELHGGELVASFECPSRIDFILARIEEVNLGVVEAPQSFGLDPVLRVHQRGFVDFLQNCWRDWLAEGYGGVALPSAWPARGMRQDRVPDDIRGRLGYFAFAADTSIEEGTWQAVRASADVALSAQKHVLKGARAAFALCRPPGHHAASDLYGGYCFLNNAAIAAQAFRDEGAKRVAVLDVDFHHGNGTQEIFYGRDDVLFVSLHGDPGSAFPHFLGHADETGKGAGEGFNVNLPLPPGTSFDEWAIALEEALRRISDFSPDVLVVSLGVDTFKDDPISLFRLESDDFKTYGARLALLGLPTLFVMEGGYAVEEIGINTVNVLTGFDNAL